MRRYEALPHTADIGIAAYGETLAEVFENAAYGMFDLMFDLARVPAEEELSVEAAGETTAELLVAWLSALLAEAEIRELAFSRFAVEHLGKGWLRGRVWGAAAAGRELTGPPVKAVTFHEMAVERVAGGWRAQVIFDV